MNDLVEGFKFALSLKDNVQVFKEKKVTVQEHELLIYALYLENLIKREIENNEKK